MLTWLHNPHADYVLAAYGLALTALIGLALVSWRWAKAQEKALQKLTTTQLDKAS